MRGALLVSMLLGSSLGCSSESGPVLKYAGSISETLHATCVEDVDCSEVEFCASRDHFEGPIVTCEIACTEDTDCPAGYACNQPPCVPDDVMCTYCAPL
jgi:hypothetical protein